MSDFCQISTKKNRKVEIQRKTRIKTTTSTSTLPPDGLESLVLVELLSELFEVEFPLNWARSSPILETSLAFLSEIAST